MPTFQLDGRPVPFEAGDTILRAADRAGIEIPHYCWHPGLSVAANCRMCLVEVLPPDGQKPLLLDVLAWDAQKNDYVPRHKPKLLPACQVPVTENMRVLSQTSPEVEAARRSVQEFLLLNHPVDCPICDQAGECRLQDYWLEHGRFKKRMRDEVVHKPKAVVFGPTIVYDAERCIVCTRCVRFCAEVARDPVLSVRERGNLNEIVLAPGRRLDHPYTLMTEYVCPVGALTAVDFRFKARVWFLRSARTVCPGCATGCNAFLDYDPRTQKAYRHRPRENQDVNTWWMCDEGMLSYARLAEDRLADPRIGGMKASWADALEEVRRLLSSAPAATTAVVLSAEHSLEDDFALLDFARRRLGAAAVYATGRPRGAGDAILRHEDKNPNAAGVARLVAPGAPRRIGDLPAAAKAGTVTHVLAIGSHADAAEADLRALAEDLDALVVLSANASGLAAVAQVALPAAAWAEAAGTFVNARGKAQRSEKAVDPPGTAVPAWEGVGRVARALGHPADWRKVADVRAAMDAPAGEARAAAAESRVGAS